MVIRVGHADLAECHAPATQAHSARRSAASSRSSPISTSSVTPRSASPHGSRSSSDVRIPARSTKPRRGFAGEVDEALRADEPVAERLDHREHALADERCVVAERDRDQLVAVVMAWRRARRARARRALHARSARGSSTHAVIASAPASSLGKLARSACGASSSSRAWVARTASADATSSFASSTRSAAIACARASSRSPSAAAPDSASTTQITPGRDDAIARCGLLRRALRRDRIRARAASRAALEDRGRLRDAGGLEHDVIGLRARDDVADAVPQVVLDIDLAAHAAARELEHVAAAR